MKKSRLSDQQISGFLNAVVAAGGALGRL